METVSTAVAAMRLGISRQRVVGMIHDGRLLGWPADQGRYRVALASLNDVAGVQASRAPEHIRLVIPRVLERIPGWPSSSSTSAA